MVHPELGRHVVAQAMKLRDKIVKMVKPDHIGFQAETIMFHTIIVAGAIKNNWHAVGNTTSALLRAQVPNFTLVMGKNTVELAKRSGYKGITELL